MNKHLKNISYSCHVFSSMLLLFNSDQGSCLCWRKLSQQHDATATLFHSSFGMFPKNLLSVKSEPAILILWLNFTLPYHSSKNRPDLWSSQLKAGFSLWIYHGCFSDQLYIYIFFSALNVGWRSGSGKLNILVYTKCKCKFSDFKMCKFQFYFISQCCICFCYFIA